MNRIALLRKKNNMTQKELADKLGISSVTLSRYETEARTPSINTVKSIADLFKVPIDYLMGETFSDKFSEITEKTISSLDKVTSKKFKEYVFAFQKLNEEGKKELFKYSNYLVSQEEYKEQPNNIVLEIDVGDEKIKANSDFKDFDIVFKRSKE